MDVILPTDSEPAQVQDDRLSEMIRLAFAFLLATATLFGADLTGTWRGDA